MNRADAMLKVLRSSDGWIPRRILFARADRFFLTNNAASELRARGYDVEHRVIKGQHHYRLTDPAAGRRPSPPSEVSPRNQVDRVDEGPHPPSTPVAVQLRLVA